MMSTSFTQNEASQVGLLSAPELRQRLENQAMTLVDVREAGEHMQERIVGSKLMSLSQFDPQAVLELPQPIVLYCLSGNRSGQATQRINQALSQHARSVEIYNLRGGITAWKQAGYKTEINPNAPLPMMRQVQIAAGSMVLAGTLLAALVSPWFLLLTGFVGSGLVFAGVTGFCGMAELLAKLPYNRVA